MPAARWIPTLTIEGIESAVIYCGSRIVGDEKLGVNKVTLNARLRREFGRDQSDDLASVGVTLTQSTSWFGNRPIVLSIGTGNL